MSCYLRIIGNTCPWKFGIRSRKSLWNASWQTLAFYCDLYYSVDYRIEMWWRHGITTLKCSVFQHTSAIVFLLLIKWVKWRARSIKSFETGVVRYVESLFLEVGKRRARSMLQTTTRSPWEIRAYPSKWGWKCQSRKPVFFLLHIFNYFVDEESSFPAVASADSSSKWWSVDTAVKATSSRTKCC